MADRLGQVNSSGGEYALFLKLWSTEVLTHFHAKTVMVDKVRTKTIPYGESARFPYMGHLTAQFHAAGTDLLTVASTANKNEQRIYVDRPLESHVELDALDEAMSEINYRAELTEEMGKAIADSYDKYALQKLVMTARSTTVITGGSDGEVLAKGATVATNSQTLIDAISEAMQKLDEKNVPSMDRFIYMRPAQYHLLLNDSTNNASRFNLDKDIGSTGSFSKGIVGNIFGATVVMTNNLPSTDLSSAITGDRNDYSADFSDTTCVVAHKSAIGSVLLKGVQTKIDDKPHRLSTFLVSYIMTGFGSLRPEAAVEISKGATT